MLKIVLLQKSWASSIFSLSVLENKFYFTTRIRGVFWRSVIGPDYCINSIFFKHMDVGFKIYCRILLCEKRIFADNNPCTNYRLIICWNGRFENLHKFLKKSQTLKVVAIECFSNLRLNHWQDLVYSYDQQVCFLSKCLK